MGSAFRRRGNVAGIGDRKIEACGDEDGWEDEEKWGDEDGCGDEE